MSGLPLLQAEDTDVIIYHNPACETSRNVMAMIRNTGVEPHVIEYLKCPPSRQTLERLAQRAGLPLRGLLRASLAAEYGLRDGAISSDDLLTSIAAYPILLNRPIVVTPWGVRLCRPSETVLEILPLPHLGPLAKEDGELVIDAQGQRVTRVPDQDAVPGGL